ncbi:protealysin inhibitor emfourin [Streptomyces sp. NPDC003027]
MRIRVRRTGGFAGIERSAEVDTSEQEDAVEWHTLADAVLRDGDDDGPEVPDGFSYEITIDGATVHCADPRLTQVQRALIGKVLKEGA